MIRRPQVTWRRILGVLVTGALVVTGVLALVEVAAHAAPHAGSRRRAVVHPSPHAKPPVDGLHRLWSTPVTGYVDGIAADDDAVAVTSGGRVAWLLDGADGHARWKADVPDLVNDPPALGRDVVVVPVSDGVVALSRADGHSRWELRGLHDALPAITAPDTVISDSVVVSTSTGTVALLTASTGALRWQVERQGRIRAAPSIGSNGIAVVAVGDEASDLAVLDATTGATRWTAAITDGSSAPLIVDDLVVVGAGDHHLVARHLGDGTVAWSTPTAAGFESLTRPGAARTPTGSVVVAADHFGDVTAVDAGTGHIRWSSGLGPERAIVFGAPVASGDHVVLGGLLTPLSVISLTNGQRGTAPPTSGMVTGIAAVRRSLVFGLRLVLPGRVERWGW